MSQYDDDQPSHNERATARRVQEALQAMHAERSEFLRAVQAGVADERDHLRFQARILDVREELVPFRNKASEMWEDATAFEEVGLDALPRLLQPRQVTEQKEVGLGRVAIKTRQEPQTLTADHLRQISEELDEIANEIGFEPAPTVSPGDVDGGML